MRALRVGRRNEPFARYRVLLFEDRLEEVRDALTGLEIKRFFFDEAQFATVHREGNWLEVGLAGALGLFFLLLTVAVLLEPPVEPVAAAIAGGTTLALGGITAYLLRSPPHRMAIRAPDHALEFRLPRRGGPREEALRRVVRAVERYQGRHAPPKAPPAEAPP